VARSWGRCCWSGAGSRRSIKHRRRLGSDKKNTFTHQNNAHGGMPKYALRGHAAGSRRRPNSNALATPITCTGGRHAADLRAKQHHPEGGPNDLRTGFDVEKIGGPGTPTKPRFFQKVEEDRRQPGRMNYDFGGHVPDLDQPGLRGAR